MKGAKLAAIVYIAVLCAISSLSAHQAHTGRHRHRLYKFIDLGTFGGPLSIVAFGEESQNSQGAFVGNSDTAMPDPFAPICFFSPNCLVNRGFKWEDGVLRQLPALGPMAESEAHGINEHGVVVGQAQTGAADATGFPVFRAVMWKDQQVIDLGTLSKNPSPAFLGANGSGALSINNLNQVVGIGVTDIPDPTTPGATQIHGFIWDGKMHDLGTLGGPSSFAGSINDLGQVGGISFTAPDLVTGQSAQRAFVWERGRMVDVGTLGGNYGDGFALNNRGQGIGDSTLAGDTELHGFLWERGKILDLGTLGGTFSSTRWLSEGGHVAGLSSMADGFVHGFLWRNGKMEDLGLLDNDQCSVAWGMNSKDQVVGNSSPDCEAPGRAFLWEDGEMVDLNKLIPLGSSLQLVYSLHINDRGEILGIGVPAGVDPNNVEQAGHAYALIPLDPDRYGYCECDNSARVNPAGKENLRAREAASRMITRSVQKVREGRKPPWHQR